MLIFLFAYLLPYEVLAVINVLDIGLVPLEKDSVGLQFYVDIENEDRARACTVNTRTKRCCLTDSEKEDCDVMHVYSSNINEVKPRDRKTLLFVYPTLLQHDLMGYCEFVVNYRCGNKRDREYATIPFDTKIPTGKHVPDQLKNYVELKRRSECSFLDEDSLNDCEPVNCDYKYSGIRPYYDNKLSKCTKTVKCVATAGKKLPDIVYVPKSNVCRDLDRPLTMEDILEISKGIMVTTEPLTVTDRNLKVELKSNCSSISQNLYILRDMMFGKLCPFLNIDTSDFKTCVKHCVLRILASILSIVIVLLMIVAFIILLGWLGRKFRDGTIQRWWANWRSKYKKKEPPMCCRYKVSHVNSEVKNSLLRQVIVRDIPMELRDSVVDICDRMEREVKWKKRYRKADVGSQVSLGQGDGSTSDVSSNTDDDDYCEESASLLKK